MHRIAIIGAGFSGLMTAYHLIAKSEQPIEIALFGERESFAKGIAYTPYSRRHILNVPTVEMSAFPDRPTHFLDWVMRQEDYAACDRNIVAEAFMPRYLYGQYLETLWEEAEQLGHLRGHCLRTFFVQVKKLRPKAERMELSLSDGAHYLADHVVIATGNQLPRNPPIEQPEALRSPLYFQNPWLVDSVKGLDNSKPILILGNGLTMVDTVLGLQEQGFDNQIISLSPNGFNILPHRHGGLQYPHLVNDLQAHNSLYDIVKLFMKHVRAVRAFGLSAEPVVNSLRPHTQRIWQGLSADEKKKFMNSSLRHLWGVARHRIPTHIHDKLTRLQLEQRLIVYAGKLINIKRGEKDLIVTFFDKKHKQQRKVIVGRLINCTGPETDYAKVEGHFLNDCLAQGLIVQDELKLGLEADPGTFELCHKDGRRQVNLLTLGSNLKGVLWESTAVNELRDQAARLAQQLLAKLPATETERPSLV